MRQWTMRITKYADRLLDDLDRLDWPDAIKLMQRNWIGRSEGARVRFGSTAGPIEVFTTRPDTLFGATFMVLSPEHPLVDALTTSEQQSAVAKYRETAAALQDADRTDDSRKKTGVFIGAYATNPVNGAQIPVWIADYVLMGYGTGAIMAVPSGDERDMEFATAYNLPVIDVVNEDGEYINSSNDSVSLNGKRTKAEAISLMTAWLDKNEHGNSAITYKLRDWLFSRQRYWGEPFPIVYDENDQPISVPASALPVLLPELADFKPQALDPNDETTNPIPPLARIQDWVNVTLDLGDGPKQYRREVNVMPQWAGSCWYELRYLDPTNTEAFIDKDVEKYWMGPKHDGHTGGVDLYVGGVEHAVLHLLYARFWHKVLHDLGHVSSEEPFHRLFNQGYIQAYAYRDERGQTVPANEVEEANGAHTWQGEKVIREYGKMGKSLKNIVTPDEMYDEFGADTFRLYEMSTGPLDASRPWNTRDVVGMQRFLQRSWRNLVDEDSGELHVSDAEAPLQLKRDLHKSINGVGIDMQNLRFNTAISKLIELNNALTIYVNEHGSTPREVAVPLVQMLSPLCPHMAEELWSMLGQTTELTFMPFPVADPAMLVSDTIEIPIQVNGKVRSKLSVLPTVTDDELRALALADEKVIALLNGAEPAKVVIVPKRLVNVVL
jgi:leucyl-tRNA synthetase